jgi:DHA2 family multidrug resistance protein
LAIADAYRALGVLALCLIPLALCMTRIPAPDVRATSPRASVSSTPRE